jgi:predicted Fe-Mo cluster-binding NifX family protein
MKIVISSQKPDLNSPCNPRFGKCAFFIFYDLEKDEYESMENPFSGTYGGAGIQAAQFVIQERSKCRYFRKDGAECLRNSGIYRDSGIHDPGRNS